ncbi:MAG TPA: hypothetical protein VE010_19155 [Thermoanaerobaculia bacterium]|nr:hypothetical protein [Thermoanaerobaculia bacterium]
MFGQTDDDDISFDPATTQAQFEEFSRRAAQAIYHTPVEPARAGNLLRFDIGISATAVPVDPNALYFRNAVNEDFTISDHIVVPRLVVSKGISVATVSASYAKVPDTGISVVGGALDIPIINGGLISPTLALRGSYSMLQGVEEYDLKTYGVELFLSKGFGPITPYAAIGRARSDAEGRVNAPVGNLTFSDEADSNRYTLGVRISMFIPKLVVEATQGEERSYAAKVSFGL